MMQIFVMLAALLLSNTGIAQETLSGFWHNAENDITIEIRKTGKGHEGIIRNHANPQANGRRMLYLTQYNENARLWTGTLFALKRNKELDATAQLKSASVLEVTAKAGWFSKTLHWTRMESPANAPGSP